MSGFIFPNSAYFLTFGLADDLVEQVNEFFSKGQGIRVIHYREFEPLQQALVKIKYLSGIIFSESVYNSFQPIIDSLDSKRCLKFILDSATDKIENQWNWIRSSDSLNLFDLLKNAIDFLVPERLGDLAVHCANQAFKIFSAHSESEFSIVSSDRQLESFSIMVQLDAIAAPYTGRCWLRVDETQFSRYFPSDKDHPFTDKFSDACSEFCNQFLGLINRHLQQLNLSPSVCLPIVYNSDSLQGVKKTGTYIPSTSVSDTHRCFQIELGFINIEGGTHLDLSPITFTDFEEDDVEFF
jgi:hypothetical protein